jgi:predicted transcriptional regulator
MPKYNVVGDTLLEAITRLVHAVTEDAIKDEAREWQNATTQAPL